MSIRTFATKTKKQEDSEVSFDSFKWLSHSLHLKYFTLLIYFFS